MLGGLLAAGADTIHLINIGTAPNDGTGDSLRTAFVKVNSNFVTLAARPLADLSGYYTKAEVMRCWPRSRWRTAAAPCSPRMPTVI